ncbi:MAG: regulatory protein RecX [Bacteroidota bacterium]
MRVTKIVSQKKHRGRKSLFAEGEFIIGVSDETLLAAGIRSGDDLGPDKLQALKAIEDLNSARRAALRYLASRPRTEREIRDKLREKEFSDEEINRTIHDLQRSRLINDEEFARMYVRDALQRRPPGRLLLKQKMLLLGLDKSTIEGALDEIYPEENQGESALQAAESLIAKKSPPQTREEWMKLRSKLSSFLGRRGYPWGVIQPALKHVLGQHYEEKADE